MIARFTSLALAALALIAGGGMVFGEQAGWGDTFVITAFFIMIGSFGVGMVIHTLFPEGFLPADSDS